MQAQDQLIFYVESFNAQGDVRALANAHRFRHTHRRVAMHKGTGSGMNRAGDVGTSFVEERVACARQRRAKYLHAKAKAQADHRSKVEAQTNERVDHVAGKLSTKLELAAQRREMIQQERSAALEVAERVRTTRRMQARSKRSATLIYYAQKVAPLLEFFRSSGLSLQGARTTEEVEQILMQDNFSHCSACAAVPKQPKCPASGKRHSKALVAVSESFLCATGELRQILHNDRRRCTEQAKAHLSDDSDAATLPSERADPVGLPHFLPLAFHEACGFRADADEQKLYAARNVVLLLEEIQAGATCVVHDYIRIHDTLEEASDLTVEDVLVRDNLDGCPLAEVSFQELHSKCEHLRHTLSRFVKSWLQFAMVMRMEQDKQTETQGRAEQSKAAHQMIRSYVQLTVAQYWREEDIQRRGDLIASGLCPTPLKNREEMVSQRREELNTAINLQMCDLRRVIESLGFGSELDEQLKGLDYSNSSSSTGGPAKSAPRSKSTSTEVCGLSSEAQSSSLDGMRQCRSIPPVNSADWCDNLCFSETDNSPEPNRSAPLSRNRRTSPVQPKPTTARSSANFRAQLAADRRRMRAQHKVEKAAEDPLMDGNDGDAEAEVLQ